MFSVLILIEIAIKMKQDKYSSHLNCMVEAITIMIEIVGCGMLF